VLANRILASQAEIRNLPADEQSCVPLTDALSSLSYMDGAHIARGGGTAYEALLRANVNGNDRVLITGLGPVGLSVGMIAYVLDWRVLRVSQAATPRGVDLYVARPQNRLW
jgi:D-arabinose 1-dehydrogenase-like Zn-dependent alcohol dehydrogenase